MEIEVDSTVFVDLPVDYTQGANQLVAKGIKILPSTRVCEVRTRFASVDGRGCDRIIAQDSAIAPMFGAESAAAASGSATSAATTEDLVPDRDHAIA